MTTMNRAEQNHTTIKSGKRENTIKPPEQTRAKKRWGSAIRKVVTEQATNRTLDEDYRHEGLIDEIKRAKHGRSRVKEGVLTLLKSQASITEKVFDRHKYSAKEIFVRRKAKSRILTTEVDEYTLAEYDRQAQLRYTITPEIRTKLDKIKAAAEEAERKRHGEKPSIFDKLLQTTILGQILKTVPRYYTMDPHEHLPMLCRRCRRPLKETLESRFTSVGILFCILFPIIGILLLFANKEFVCVVCEETYVYGDLTARPEEFDSEGEDDFRKQN